MLPYRVDRAVWTGLLLFTAAACSFDASGLVSVGSPSGTSTTSGGDSTTATGPTTGTPPTTAGPGGSDSDSDSTTTPVDPTVVTTDATTTTTTPGTSSTTEPDTTTTTEPDTTTSTTEPDTTTSTTSTTEPDTTTGMMMVCNDPGPEPNETHETAVDRGDKHCKADPSNFTGVLNGQNDVDWHYYNGDFSGGGCGNVSPNPRAAVAVEGGPLQVCVYVECDQGDGVEGNFSCPGGTTFDTEGSWPGCCGPGSMNFEVDCKGSGNESARVYVRLDSAMPDACVNYSVDYSYKN